MDCVVLGLFVPLWRTYDLVERRMDAERQAWITSRQRCIQQHFVKQQHPFIHWS